MSMHQDDGHDITVDKFMLDLLVLSYKMPRSKKKKKKKINAPKRKIITSHL